MEDLKDSYEKKMKNLQDELEKAIQLQKSVEQISHKVP